MHTLQANGGAVAPLATLMVSVLYSLNFVLFSFFLSCFGLRISITCNREKSDSVWQITMRLKNSAVYVKEVSKWGLVYSHNKGYFKLILTEISSLKMRQACIGCKWELIVVLLGTAWRVTTQTITSHFQQLTEIMMGKFQKC